MNQTKTPDSARELITINPQDFPWTETRKNRKKKRKQILKGPAGVE